jgi:hypothetical protein
MFKKTCRNDKFYCFTLLPLYFIACSILLYKWNNSNGLRRIETLMGCTFTFVSFPAKFVRNLIKHSTKLKIPLKRIGTYQNRILQRQSICIKYKNYFHKTIYQVEKLPLYACFIVTVPKNSVHKQYKIISLYVLLTDHTCINNSSYKLSNSIVKWLM